MLKLGTEYSERTLPDVTEAGRELTSSGGKQTLSLGLKGDASITGAIPLWVLGTLKF